MPDALVTGAAGFIGRHLIRRLLADGKTVRCLVRKTSNLDHLPVSAAELHYGDVTDSQTLAGMAKDVSVVYHLAALGHVSAITEDAYRRFHMVNVQGTRNLIEECLQWTVRKFVHVSSVAAMGVIDGETTDETTPPQPVTPYERSKLESEQAALRYWQEKQFPVVVVRPSMVYGPEGPDTEFIKIVRLVQKGWFPVFGRGSKLTAGVYVTDLVDGLIRAAERGRCGEVYILTGAESFQFDHMLELIARNLGKKHLGPRLPLWLARAAACGFEVASRLFGIAPPMTRQNVQSIIADRQYSIEKALHELGYESRTTLQDGIQTVIHSTGTG